MILHSACVENYKGIRSPLQVDFDLESPNLLEGPNGVGKSSLVEAIQSLLTENHNAAGAAVEAMRPRETALTPTISAVFETGGLTYRITKTFLDSPKAVLERKQQDGHFEMVAKGRAADEQVREMLRGRETRAKDKSGERLGLFSILCSSQGEQELPGLSGDALADIRGMLGAQISGKQGDAFHAAVNKRHSALWTPGGKPKKGRFAEIQTDLREAKSELDRSQEVIRNIGLHENAAREHRSRCREKEQERQSVQKDAETLAPIARQVIELRTRKSLAASNKATADARYSQLRSEIERIADAIKKRRSCEEAVPRLEDAERIAQGELEKCIQEATAAQEAWKAGTQADVELERNEERIQRLGAFLSLIKEIPALEGRLQHASDAGARRSSSEETAAALNAPDTAHWAAIQSAGQAFDEARLRVEALELRVEISAERDLAIDIVTGDPAGEAQIAANQSLIAHADGQLKIRLPGIAGITVAGPSGDAAQWRSRLEQRRIHLTALLAPFEVSNWRDLTERVEQLMGLSARIVAANADMRAALGRDTLVELEARLRELTRHRDEILTIESTWAEQQPDLATLKAWSEARKQERAQAQAQTVRRWERAQGERSKAELTAVTAAAARRTNQEKLATSITELETLEADGRSMAERQDDLSARRRMCESAEESLKTIDEALATLPEDAPERLDLIKQGISVLDSEIQRVREAYTAEEAAARALSVQGPYTTLATAEERVKQLQDDEAVENLRLNTIQRLKDAVDEAKAKVLAGIAEPVEKRATAILERIVGYPFAKVQLGDEMQLESIRPQGCKNAASVEQVSAGEQEQIYFATRLALAEVLSAEERQVLVLDDPLVNTDADRLPRVMELVKEKSDRLQFVILTCHPERYIDLPVAAVRHMEKSVPSEALS